MRKYEAVLIFVPSQEEEKRVQLLERFKGIIEAEGTISNVDEWGIRKLAYPINDIGEGYYILMNFEGTPEAVKELDRVAKISDSIMRHMIIREDE
ncbi:30S ribosomal protein S6 [Tissierella sp. MSJ-40]|jgi:small subunit ribosomal protein S6|uniref:Small ribosomal subunit protein bS6 n=1 Tax=Tissierella simiarum TaxID=2841534 RepID=A0ABS6E930_9FIRM|nr:30S ribosomal protein S6 [Tissierella simiarum]MBU5439346.1 30S ribosomal protein S6 [Tissierella simiarum]